MRAIISRTALLFLLSLIAAAAICNRSAIADPAPAAATVQGTFNGLSQDRTSVSLTLDSESQPRTIPVGALADKFKAAQNGDVVKIEVDNAGNPKQITKVDEISRPVSVKARLIALAIAFLILLLCAGAVTRCKPQSFLIGVDNRYSNSQFQIALWFTAVAIVYAAAVALRWRYLGWDFIGGVGLPQNLIVLTGLSAFTFGGAKAITVSKLTPAQLADPATSPKGVGTPNLLKDLVQNDTGRADLGDFQMILIVMTATIIFLLTAFHYLGLLAFEKTVTLPDVDTTLLSGFGLGQGAYLLKKAALPAGQG